MHVACAHPGLGWGCMSMKTVAPRGSQPHRSCGFPLYSQDRMKAALRPLRVPDPCQAGSMSSTTRASISPGSRPRCVSIKIFDRLSLGLSRFVSQYGCPGSGGTNVRHRGTRIGLTSFEFKMAHVAQMLSVCIAVVAKLWCIDQNQPSNQPALSVQCVDTVLRYWSTTYDVFTPFHDYKLHIGTVCTTALPIEAIGLAPPSGLSGVDASLRVPNNKPQSDPKRRQPLGTSSGVLHVVNMIVLG